MIKAASLKFTVPDMDCKGCVSSITQAVKQVDANASVEADLDTKYVVVGSNVAATEIAKAIEGAGFTVQAS